METVEIQVVLTEAAVADILNAITNTSARLLARDPDAIYATLQQRRAAVGGMLELARRLNAHRAVLLRRPKGSPSRAKPLPAASAAATGGRWPRIGFANPKRDPTGELRPSCVLPVDGGQERASPPSTGERR